MKTLVDLLHALVTIIVQYDNEQQESIDARDWILTDINTKTAPKEQAQVQTLLQISAKEPFKQALVERIHSIIQHDKTHQALLTYLSQMLLKIHAAINQLPLSDPLNAEELHQFLATLTRLLNKLPSESIPLQGFNQPVELHGLLNTNLANYIDNLVINPLQLHSPNSAQLIQLVSENLYLKQQLATTQQQLAQLTETGVRTSFHSMQNTTSPRSTTLWNATIQSVLNVLGTEDDDTEENVRYSRGYAQFDL